MRRYGFHHRYDTATELPLLTQLWPLINNRLNSFTPTKKPIGCTTDSVGRCKPTTAPLPYQRLLTAGVLSPAQETELATYKTIAISRAISDIPKELTRLTAGKTRRLHDRLESPDPTSLKIPAS